jgi:hypothetical protein
MQSNLMEFTEILYIATSLSSRQSRINQDYLVTSRNLPVTLRRVQLHDETCDIERHSTLQLLPMCLPNSLCASLYTELRGEGGGGSQCSRLLREAYLFTRGLAALQT